MPSQHAEIKAGIFVAFCLALLFVMVFAIGDCRQVFSGRQERVVLFSQVTGLASNSAVNYAGVEIGRVRAMHIENVDAELLARMPKITPEMVDRLPVSFQEADELKAVSTDKDEGKELDRRAREVIRGRPMIAVVLEVSRGRHEVVFREGDLVRLEATLMGQSTVDISPGRGQPLPAGQDLVGDGSNLVSQMGASMREIRKLLERLSGTIGEEERASIKAMIAHYKTVSEDVTHTVADVKAMVAENRKPVRDAVADMRKTMEETRKAAEEARPLAVGALDSGKKMFDEGQRVAKETAGLIEEVRPQAASLIANADKAAKATAGALAELEKLVGEAELAVNENRPTLRRAMLDARESTRNLEEMTDRLKREPWLLFKKQSGSQEAAVLDSAARNLRETSENLAVAMGYLQTIAADPESAKRLGKENVEGLLEQVRAACRELQGRRDAIEKKLKEVERKSGGAPLERQREEADRAQ